MKTADTNPIFNKKSLAAQSVCLISKADPGSEEFRPTFPSFSLSSSPALGGRRHDYTFQSSFL